MTPQSAFMLVAKIAPGREPALRALLATMNAEPGWANPHNAVLPFGIFDALHYARWVVLEDQTLADYAAHGMQAPDFPKQVVFMGDCDGDARALLADMAQRAAPGLRKLFAHCEDFDDGRDLLDWMHAHEVPIGANYVNWRGRTVRQVKEESTLQKLLSTHVQRDRLRSGAEVQQLRQELIAVVNEEQRAGRLALTPEQPTALGWRIRNFLHVIGVPLVGLLLSPLLLLSSPFILYVLRQREKQDPEIRLRPEPAALQALRDIEDRDATNQFSALGPVKPGRFRRWLITVVVLLIDYASRHVFNRGHLGRVRTIHFARWVFVDDKARVFFASSYDGSHEAYMDDFINKVAWGLNLVFSNGIGWPRTDWLIKRGARFEQRFKYFQRRHQIPSQTWYKAYPGITALDMIRNHRIRAGLEKRSMTDAEALAWLKLL